MPIPGHVVQELEEECEDAIQSIVQKHFDNLPAQTAHLMAKAAVTVLEAAVGDEVTE